MKRKVAFIIPSLRGGGAERVMINIINKLNHNKFDITLILLKKEGPYVKLIPDNVNVVDLDTFRVRKSIIPLIRTLNRINPDVILSTMRHLNLIILAIRPFLKGTPKIIVREANTPSKNMSKKDEMFYFFYRFLYSKSDLIIAQCKEMKKDIVEYFKIDEQKIVYIYNPLDIGKIKDLAKKGNPYKVSNKINILSVGRLSPEKGFDILLEALQVVVEKVPNVHLTILGEGNLKSELLYQAEELGIKDKISLLGFNENPYPYYHYADIYVLSSRTEGFPNSLLEALACGTKVVATNCKSGPKEIIGENVFGTLVEEGDHKSLAKGIIEAISGSNKSKDRAVFFDINNIIKEYESVLSN